MAATDIGFDANGGARSQSRGIGVGFAAIRKTDVVTDLSGAARAACSPAALGLGFHV